MSLLTPLGKPQYLFRPRCALKRFLVELHILELPNFVRLPWGENLEVDLADPVGYALASQSGLFDIVTTEVVWRLTQSGDTAFDVGANIGYFTSLLAHRVGTAGKVLAFEPHPATFPFLQRNIALQGPCCGPICAYNVGLSESDGDGTLDILPERTNHTSYAFLTDKSSSTSVNVKLLRGDRFMANRSIGLMKIDAQWHEEAVLKEFGAHLRAGTIRDIVFEEEAPFPAPSHRILLDAGYTILWFEEHLRGPKIIAPSDKPKNLRPYDMYPSYLATLDPQRAHQRLAPAGWRSFN
jgi:FkbM family methyltransferase